MQAFKNLFSKGFYEIISLKLKLGQENKKETLSMKVKKFRTNSFAENIV